MNRRLIIVTAYVLLFGLAGLASLVRAASGYDLAWWSVDGGGGSSNASSYSLVGAIGQPDAGELNGTGYNLAGGFWAGVESAPAPPTFLRYLPLVEK